LLGKDWHPGLNGALLSRLDAKTSEFLTRGALRLGGVAAVRRMASR
jgi:hypothetical protein